MVISLGPTNGKRGDKEREFAKADRGERQKEPAAAHRPYEGDGVRAMRTWLIGALALALLLISADGAWSPHSFGHGGVPGTKKVAGHDHRRNRIPGGSLPYGPNNASSQMMVCARPRSLVFLMGLLAHTPFPCFAASTYLASAPVARRNIALRNGANSRRDDLRPLYLTFLSLLC